MGAAVVGAADADAGGAEGPVVAGAVVTALPEQAAMRMPVASVSATFPVVIRLS